MVDSIDWSELISGFRLSGELSAQDHFLINSLIVLISWCSILWEFWMTSWDLAPNKNGTLVCWRLLTTPCFNRRLILKYCFLRQSRAILLALTSASITVDWGQELRDSSVSTGVLIYEEELIKVITLLFISVPLRCVCVVLTTLFHACFPLFIFWDFDCVLFIQQLLSELFSLLPFLLWFLILFALLCLSFQVFNLFLINRLVILLLLKLILIFLLLQLFHPFSL